ncbi:MAG: CoA transferase [Burkholderiales bacterium]|nr:CoA transferase [Burkholderiales bacterium]
MGDLAFGNVRILDFTHYLAGPVGTFQLAMQGADVIKIEPRAGDGMRASGGDRAWAARGMGPGWMAANAGKRSLTVDLGRPEGVAVVRRLAAGADVVCENFRPGVMERLGVGWSQLSALNPRLIYCAVSGFGATGPDSAEPAFDGKIQAMSGLMSLTGEPAQGPMRAGFAVADVATGVMTAFAIATALFQRTHTGTGQFVDVAMLDTMLNFLACQAADTTVSGARHQQMGNLSMSRKPTADRFRCGSGHLVLAVLTDKQFANLMRALDRADALDDPRFADWDGRTRHVDALRAIIEGAMAAGDPRDWERRLNAADVPCGAVYGLDEILAHRQVAHRGLLQAAPTPHGPATLVGPAFRLAHGNGGVGPVAALGEHTDAILAEAGYAAGEIAALRAAGVI